jgi:LmbE family N-acetylglucosaminyl deacetylase
MMQLNLGTGTSGKLKILCLGSHSDDIEIGCGGTILSLLEQHPGSVVYWVVFSATGIRRKEALQSAELFAGSSLKEPILKTFQDGFMPYHGVEVKSVFESDLKDLSPDLILTHSGKDAHQDHRLISELTWNTFRDHFIMEYEIPKYDGDLGQPNLFVPLRAEVCDRKICYLMEAFKSQQTKRWFEKETFLSLMRLRGMECNAPSRYAEAFYCRKVQISLIHPD